MDKVKKLKQVFDKFLKENGAYEAWYERYRLDNLIYADKVPMKRFLESYINNCDNLGMLFYDGIGGTCLTTKEGAKFIEENKKCDILSNSLMADLDLKWIDNYKTLLNIKN